MSIYLTSKFPYIENGHPQMGVPILYIGEFL